jgi:regulator of cell morphogenesis and NO signaling
MENSNTNILDATLLEPGVKHTVIFARYDELKPGEQFILYNDHDPKPLYYQLVEQKGEVFTWEYLERGPEWWKIKITKNK